MDEQPLQPNTQNLDSDIFLTYSTILFHEIFLYIVNHRGYVRK